MEGDISAEGINHKWVKWNGRETKSKTKETGAKDVEAKPFRKSIAWSSGTPTIVVPAVMRDALGLKPKEMIEVEISLLDDGLGMLVRVLASGSY